MIRTGIGVPRFGRVARGAGGAAPVEVPECAGPGRAVGVSNGKRQVGRAWGQAENTCRAGGDAGARRGRRRGGWTESEGVGGRVSARGWWSNWRTCGWGWWGVERCTGGWASGARGLDGSVRCPPWSARGRGGARTWGRVRDTGRLVRVPTATRSRWSGVRPGGRDGVGPATLSSDAEFKISRGSACHTPGAAPRRVASRRRCARAARKVRGGPADARRRRGERSRVVNMAAPQGGTPSVTGGVRTEQH